ncbi:MAG: ExeA family protein [Planctomycetota bacterium]|jgi:general secretion pathway protein A
MYEDYWGLDKAPYNESHIRDNFVEYPALQLALSKLKHIADHGQCAAAISGPAGIGKTALAREFARSLPGDIWAVSYIVNPLGDPESIIRNIAHDLGGTNDNASEAMVEAVESLCSQGRRACIIIDEAHTIRQIELLENIRMLMNFEVEGMSLTVILVGQEGLLRVLKKASYFNQRLSLKISLSAMNEDESKHYILSRLKTAGCQRGIFTRSAAEKICQLSNGVPREINRICELAMIVGYGFALKKIKGDVIDMVAKELSILDASEEEVIQEYESEREQEQEYVPLAARVKQEKYRPDNQVSLSGLQNTPPPDYELPEEKEELPSFGLFRATYGDVDENSPVLKDDIMASYDNIDKMKTPPEELGEDVLSAVDAQPERTSAPEDDILANL